MIKGFRQVWDLTHHPKVETKTKLYKPEGKSYQLHSQTGANVVATDGQLKMMGMIRKGGDAVKRGDGPQRQKGGIGSRFRDEYLRRKKE